MPWSRSLVLRLLAAQVGVLLGLLGIQLFYLLADPPAALWYLSIATGVLGFAAGLRLGVRLRARLAGVREFLAVAARREHLPSLPVWAEDELGSIERGLPRLLGQESTRLHEVQAEREQREAVLQSMTDGVAVIDLKGRVILCNRTARALFGIRQDEAVAGKLLQSFSRYPWLHELLREVMSNHTDVRPSTREVDIKGPDRRFVAVSVVQLSEAGRGATGAVLVFHDVTQLKRLEAIRADFVANVSHELRTPLTAIKGYAETLLNGALREPDLARRFLVIINRHSERLSRLIDDLLTLSNLELGKTELRHEGVVLPDIVDEVLEMIGDKAMRGGVMLRQELPTDLPTVTGDSDRMHQVLVNLIDNAVKYTPAGGTVVVSARVTEDLDQADHLVEGDPTGRVPERPLNGDLPPGRKWLEVSVADTGCGIPESEIPRLTQRFYRVDKARSRELGGTGLGLAIVKHIVQAHGGFLRIQSKPNEGTTMRFSLPLGPAAAGG